MSVVQDNGLRERFSSEDSALGRFWREAPYYPRCSDDKTATYSRPREFALRWPYIQANPRDRISWLIFDIDEGDGQRWEEAGLPPPNLVVQTVDGPRSVRGAHLFYAVSPICTSARARSEPIQYQRAVYAQMAELLRADLSYHSGPVAKTPGHPKWRTWEIHNHEYTLGELCEYLELPRRQRGAKGPDFESVAHSRNCTLFESLRFHAYALVGHARAGSYERFYERLLNHAESLNHFGVKGDLLFSDLRAIAKSVARWTWDRYEGSAKQRGAMRFDASVSTSERQKASALRTHRKRRDGTLAKLLAAMTGLVADGTKKLTDTALAGRARIDRRTVARYRDELLAAFSKHLAASAKPPGISLGDLMKAARGLSPQAARRALFFVQYGVHQVTGPKDRHSILRKKRGVMEPFDTS